MTMLTFAVKTGINKIDIHLDKFNEISVQIEDILSNKTCDKDLSKIFYKILFNAEDFFLDAELVLNKLRYPKLQEQKALHKGFINQVKEIETEYNNGAEDCCSKLYELLKNKCLNYFDPEKQEIFKYLQLNKDKFI